MNRTLLGVSALLVSHVAVAGGGWVMKSIPVPVDSPLALLGLATAVGLIAARLLRNRSK